VSASCERPIDHRRRHGIGRRWLLWLALTASASCAVATRATAPVVTPTGVRFDLERSGASRVALAGSFNGWSMSAHPLARNAGGLWTIVVPLPPGEYRFMFVVDGEWMSPPLAEDYADDGFGGTNGIVVVR
jgi:1,4-alpha-glucan branching enzyme